MGLLDPFSDCPNRVADWRKGCTKKRDDGYEKCDKQRDAGYRKCCTWWPCRWLCKAWVWISNIVCDLYIWVSNVVCVAWGWVFYGFICVVGTALVVFVIAPIIKLVTKKGWQTGHPPDLHSAEAAKRQLSTTKDTYKALTWYQRFLGLFTTPGKKAGVLGWTDYHMRACATGLVYHSVVSTDREHTIDIEIDGEHSSLVIDEVDGITKPRYIRIELMPEVAKDMPSSTIPSVGQTVTICGKLMWDADGFLEIHPQNPSDIVIV